MRKTYIILIVIAFSFVSKPAAQNMREIFISMPDSIIPILTKVNREDCVDFFEAKMDAKVNNRFNGRASLLNLTNNFVEFNSSPFSRVQMRFLPQNNDTLICIVTTLKSQATVSRIDFYTKRWEKLENSLYFTMPTLKEFFSLEHIQKDSAESVINKADIYLVELSLNADNNSVTTTYTQPSYMSAEDSVSVSTHIHPIAYKWQNGKYIKE